ncbi:hypothetical protein RDABS01_014314 [Bienertia sinuspersici]
MSFQEEATQNPPLLSEVRQDDGDDDLHWGPHDYAILDAEEEVAVEEDELEEDEDKDEDEVEEEEEEEGEEGEGEGDDDEEEEDNNDDGGAADDLDGINQQSETHIANDDTLGHEDVNVGQGITVSDDTGNPEAKFRLHPDGLWFGHHKVVDAVVETSYKTYFKGPYYNCSVTPAEVKDRWWNAFKHEFSWDPLIASLVKKEWQSKCARRLSGIASKVCTDPSYKATWCAPALRAHMKKIRQEDEDFKRRSSQCSISAEEVKINTDEFQKKKAANLECEDETQKKSEDKLFFEVVGGWNEKGRIFGLGAAAHSYYDKPTCEEKNGKKSRREYIKNQTKQELDQTRQELGETKQGLIDTQTNIVSTQQVLIETIKTLAETTESFMTFKKQVEKFMQANPSPS